MNRKWIRTILSVTAIAGIAMAYGCGGSGGESGGTTTPVTTSDGTTSGGTSGSGTLSGTAQ
jgi:hypothetical protein